MPGEILFYPSGTWHHTFNLDPVTISVQSRMVTRSNFRHVHREMLDNCANPPPDITREYPGASPNLSEENCEAVEAGSCLDLWESWYVDPPEGFDVFKHAQEVGGYGGVYSYAQK